MSDDNDEIKDIFRKAPAPEPDAPEATTTGDRVRLPGISARAWEHPADRAALTALRKATGFDVVLRRLFSLVSERALRFHYLANAVRVDDKQFARIHKAWLECCAILDADEIPELFVTQTPMVNAGAIGIDKPFVVINSGTLGLLDDDELRFVLGHELGHVLSGHALYRTMLFILLRVVLPLLMTLPIAGLMLRGVLMALFEWSRKAELSCDRAGLLCLQDPEAAYRIHMKMAGGNKLDQMNLDAFVAQADEYEKAGDVRDNIIKLMNMLWNTHPYPVLRLAELRRWVTSGGYGAVLGGNYPRRSEDADAGIRDDVAASARSYKDRWDEREDALGKLVQDLGGLFSGEGSVWDNVRDLFRGRKDAPGDAPEDVTDAEFTDDPTDGDPPDDGPEKP